MFLIELIDYSTDSRGRALDDLHYEATPERWDHRHKCSARLCYCLLYVHASLSSICVWCGVFGFLFWACACACACACVCVCGIVANDSFGYMMEGLKIHSVTYWRGYRVVCVCEHVCMCVGEREREKNKIACVWVWVCMCVCVGELTCSVACFGSFINFFLINPKLLNPHSSQASPLLCSRIFLILFLVQDFIGWGSSLPHY